LRWPRGSARDALHRSTHRRIRQPGAASVASKASTLADSSSTASSKCAISASIGSGSGDTGCTVMCISAAGTGAKNGKSSCPVAEATLAPHDLRQQHERGHPCAAMRPFGLCVSPRITEITRIHYSIVWITGAMRSRAMQRIRQTRRGSKALEGRRSGSPSRLLSRHPR
jgi:hypothetical protein